MRGSREKERYELTIVLVPRRALVGFERVGDVAVGGQEEEVKIEVPRSSFALTNNSGDKVIPLPLFFPPPPPPPPPPPLLSPPLPPLPPLPALCFTNDFIDVCCVGCLWWDALS